MGRRTSMGTGQISGESERKRVGVGIAGANPSSSEAGEGFREEIESETKERHLTCPPNVSRKL